MMDSWTLEQILQPVCEAFLTALFPVLITAAVQAIRWYSVHAKTETGRAAAQALKVLAEAADGAVHEAEDATSAKGTTTARDKKNLATEIVWDTLKEKGIKMSDDMISGYIEKAVANMHLAWEQKQPIAKTPIGQSTVKLDIDADKLTKTLTKAADDLQAKAEVAEPVSGPAPAENPDKAHWGGGSNGSNGDA